jgi:hypothetical protein
VEEILCKECRERVKREIARRGERGKEERAYKQIATIKKEVDKLMFTLEKKIF